MGYKASGAEPSPFRETSLGFVLYSDDGGQDAAKSKLLRETSATGDFGME